MEPTIITRPASKIVGYELKTNTSDGQQNREIPVFWGDIMASNQWEVFKKLPHRVDPGTELGVCFPTNMETGDLSYVIAAEVTDFAGLPPDLFTAELPAATYAVFTTPADDGAENIAPAIQGTWEYIFQTWFPGSGYEFEEGKADFEYYGGGKVKIYIPVIKK